jgi:cell wall-associated NlpC family hydrolase
MAVLTCAAPAAFAQTTPGTTTPTPAPEPVTGGAAYGAPNPAATQVVPGAMATLLPNGMAAAPDTAPQEVKDAIAAANEIIGRPYVYGGGHNARFASKGYDCSGTVSYALHGGNLLLSPLDSGSFMKWGERGPGTWITVYTNPSHAFAVIAGLRLDTSAAGDPSGLKGPRWRPTLRSTKGYRARHPLGF